MKEPLHPYVQIYLICVRYGTIETRQPCLPGAGSVLEQDAELMLAFDLFTQARIEFDKTLEDRKKQQEILQEKANEVFGTT